MPESDYARRVRWSGVYREGAVKEDDAIALLKAARNRSGLPMDFWVELTEGLGYRALAILCGRASLFPKYMKSKDKE